MDFDSVNTVTRPDGSRVEYGMIHGNSNVVIIKAGAGGSYLGHEDKYYRLAERLHQDHGCTVLSFSNFSNTSFEDVDVDVIKDLVSQMKGGVTLYYVGVSNGATQGLLNATRHFDFSRILLFNMPLMINFHKIKAALNRVRSEIRFVYGEKDPSCSYVPFLVHASQKETCTARVEVITVPHADHNFAGMSDTFLDLAVDLFRP